MKNTVSLKLNRDFRRLYSKGRHVSGAYVAVYMSANRLKTANRLGLTASTSLGHAVIRNRLKRLMRAAYTALEPYIGTGYDFVLVARGRAVGSCEEQIRKDLRYSFRKLGLLECED
ncbi:MAG: ribonuclease P protein component [bacterium]|nr:ribonuclease P protein component [bacterium]